MNKYLVTIIAKLFSKHEVVEASSEADARAQLEAQGYGPWIKSVELITDEEE